MNKTMLYIKIRKFYKIFGEIVGPNFIRKPSDMTCDNLYDVLFDIHEVVDDCATDGMTMWLKKLYAQIIKYRNKQRWIKILFYTIGYPMAIWIVLSYVEILCKNVHPNACYSAWNIFIATINIFS